MLRSLAGAQGAFTSRGAKPKGLNLMLLGLTTKQTNKYKQTSSPHPSSSIMISPIIMCVCVICVICCCVCTSTMMMMTMVCVWTHDVVSYHIPYLPLVCVHVYRAVCPSQHPNTNSDAVTLALCAHAHMYVRLAVSVAVSCACV